MFCFLWTFKFFGCFLSIFNRANTYTNSVLFDAYVHLYFRLILLCRSIFYNILVTAKVPMYTACFWTLYTIEAYVYKVKKCNYMSYITFRFPSTCLYVCFFTKQLLFKRVKMIWLCSLAEIFNVTLPIVLSAKISIAV